MLRYRAATFFGRLYTPDLLMGMQTKEELDDVIDAKVEDSLPKVNLNNLAKTIETPVAIPSAEEPKEEKPTDPFVKIKIELRKHGVKPEESAAFIEAKGIAPEEVEAWVSDKAALIAAYENYKEAK